MMRFYHPYFLVGVAAAMLPILIYLLTRQRIQEVAFSTLRFFAGVSASLIRRKRWQEALLLVLRVAVCVLAAVAFARPYLAHRDAEQAGTMHVGKATAIVVDVSAGMTLPGAFDQAHKLIDEAISALPTDSAVTLIAAAHTPQVELPWTRDTGKFAAKVAALQPGASAPDLAAAIHEADHALSQVVAGEKQIVVVSAMQRVGWQGFEGSWKLSPGMTLDLRPVKLEKPADYAMAATDSPQSIVKDDQPHNVVVRVADYTGQPIDQVPVTLSVDGKEVETQKVNLPAGGEATAIFRCRFGQVGDSRGLVQVGGKDHAGIGTTFYFCTRVVPKIKVLILTNSAAGKSGANQAFFLQTALAPSESSPFTVQTIPASKATAADVSWAAEVILSDVDAVTPEIRAALEKLLNHGGGLLFLPGSAVNPATFSASFGDLTPCMLRKALAAADFRANGSKAMLTKIDLTDPILEIFQHPHYGDFAAAAFDRYWDVSNSQLAKVIASFDDGRPYLLAKSVKGGKTVLLASPPDPSWNNLPTRAIFVPFLHEIARNLAQHAEPQTAYHAGEVLPIPEQCSLSDPAGQVYHGSNYPAEQIGYYTVSDERGQAVLTYAVNGDPGAMNPAVVDPAEIKAALAPLGTSATQIAASGASLGAGGREMWLYVLTAVLLLSLGELWMSNQVARD